MEYLNVIAAAGASWILGAVWYSTLRKPWIEASGIECDENGNPKGGGSPVPFILSAICMLLAAGMMRHIFAMLGIGSVAKGA